ncbi:MAG: hypothetical protein L0H94_13345 [Nitrospira sp.]|nr:hypothetical protein [Nitrospira sp.]
MRHSFLSLYAALDCVAHIIHDRFYCNRRYAAATSLTASRLAARSIDILFQVCLPPSRLRVPDSLGVLAVSSLDWARDPERVEGSRTVMNTVG